MLIEISRSSRTEAELPPVLSRLANVTYHASKLLLETRDGGTFQNLQRKSIVNINHCKNGPIKEIVLSRNFQGMTIKLKAILCWIQESKHLVVKGQ